MARSTEGARRAARAPRAHGRSSQLCGRFREEGTRPRGRWWPSWPGRPTGWPAGAQGDAAEQDATPSAGAVTRSSRWPACRPCRRPASRRGGPCTSRQGLGGPLVLARCNSSGKSPGTPAQPAQACSPSRRRTGCRCRPRPSRCRWSLGSMPLCGCRGAGPRRTTSGSRPACRRGPKREVTQLAGRSEATSSSTAFRRWPPRSSAVESSSASWPGPCCGEAMSPIAPVPKAQHQPRQLYRGVGRAVRPVPRAARSHRSQFEPAAHGRRRAPGRPPSPAASHARSARVAPRMDSPRTGPMAPSQIHSHVWRMPLARTTPGCPSAWRRRSPSRHLGRSGGPPRCCG